MQRPQSPPFCRLPLSIQRLHLQRRRLASARVPQRRSGCPWKASLRTTRLGTSETFWFFPKWGLGLARQSMQTVFQKGAPGLDFCVICAAQPSCMEPVDCPYFAHAETVFICGLGRVVTSDCVDGTLSIFEMCADGTFCLLFIVGTRGTGPLQFKICRSGEIGGLMCFTVGTDCPTLLVAEHGNDRRTKPLNMSTTSSMVANRSPRELCVGKSFIELWRQK